MATNNQINVPSNTIAIAPVNTNITSMTGLTGALSAPTAIQSSAALNLVTFTYIASAVNYIDIKNGVTGQSPTITFTGTDGTVNGQFSSKNGNFKF